MTSTDGRTVDVPDLALLAEPVEMAPEEHEQPLLAGAIPPSTMTGVVPDVVPLARSAWTPSEWHGVMIVDEAGRHLGKLQDVYADVETGEPVFATVKQGLWPGRHLTFVPILDVHVEPEQLRAPTTAERVGSAPDLELHGEELTVEGESTLYHHFEQNYLPMADGGRRLIRR